MHLHAKPAVPGGMADLLTPNAVAGVQSEDWSGEPVTMQVLHSFELSSNRCTYDDPRHT